MAPIGFGLGDFVVVGKAALKLYNRVRESAGEYNQLTRETKQFSDLLQNFRDLVTRVKLSGPQFAQLVEHEKTSQQLLECIDGTLDRYQSLGGDTPKFSNKITWSKEAAHDLRSKIISHVGTLQSFHTSISQCAVLDALDWLKLSMQAGKTQCPSIASLSQASHHEDDNDDSDWSELIRDLENLGINASMARAHRDLILRFLETAVAHGELPFRNDCISLYSGAVVDYQDIVQHVNTWMEEHSSSVGVPTFSETTSITAIGSRIGAPSEQVATTLHQHRIQRRPSASLGERLLSLAGVRVARSPAAPQSPRGTELVVTSYTCIICTESLSSRGVCRRHLSEQHVAPNSYQCEKCCEKSDTQKAAKKHVLGCGLGLFSYLIVPAKPKQVYACEFTGLCFDSAPSYIEYLLKMCEKSCSPLQPDLNRKLHALLRRPLLYSNVREISQRMYESRNAWEKLFWSQGHVVKAIEELEDAQIFDDGTMKLSNGGSKSIRIYLNSLLGAGQLEGQ